jgi:hypothetical protein
MEFEKAAVSGEKPPFWKDPKPPYTMIGSGESNRMFPQGTVDALWVIGSLNKSQLTLFMCFKFIVMDNYKMDRQMPGGNANRNLNEVDLRISGIDEMKKLMQRNNNIKALTEKGIVKKGKNKRYMVNPYILIPNRDFKRHAAAWMHYKLIDADKGIDLEMVLQSMELSIDESVKQMTQNL